MSEKNFTEEEKNLIDTFVTAYMSTQIVDALPPKSDAALDLQVAFIILKETIKPNDVNSAKKILEEVCDRISVVNVISQALKK